MATLNMQPGFYVGQLAVAAPFCYGVATTDLPYMSLSRR